MHILKTPITALLIAVFGILGAISAAIAVDGTVENIRIGQHPDKIRIVMDVSKTLDFKVFSLADPYRVVVDLPEVTFSRDARPKTKRLKAIKGFRYGLFRPGTSRVVPKLRSPIPSQPPFRFRKRQSGPPHRARPEADHTCRVPLESARYVTAARAAHRPAVTTPKPAAPPFRPDSRAGQARKSLWLSMPVTVVWTRAPSGFREFMKRTLF